MQGKVIPFAGYLQKEEERYRAKQEKQCNPSEKDRKLRKMYGIPVRKSAHKATTKLNKRIIKNYGRANPPSKYAIGEKVYVRLTGKGQIHKKTSGNRGCYKNKKS